MLLYASLVLLCFLWGGPGGGTVLLCDGCFYCLPCAKKNK